MRISEQFCKPSSSIAFVFALVIASLFGLVPAFRSDLSRAIVGSIRFVKSQQPRKSPPTYTKILRNSVCRPLHLKRSTMELELELFGQMLLKNTTVQDVMYSDSDWFAHTSADCTTLLRITGVPAGSLYEDKLVNVSCLVLPDGHSWPSFYDRPIQNTALAKRVVLLKSAPLTVSTTKGPESITHLLLKDSFHAHAVALIGHSGVGKSTEVNALLPELFQVLHAKNISRLYYRIDRTLYRFTCEGDKVLCSKVDEAGHTINSLREYVNTVPKDIILVLELAVNEKHPDFSVPTVVALASRDVLSDLEAWWKGGMLNVCLRPPHTKAEMFVLSAACYQLDRETFLRNLCLQKTSSLIDVQDIVMRRMENSGLMTRQVLASECIYSRWQNHMSYDRNQQAFLQLSDEYKRLVYAPAADEVRSKTSDSFEMLLRSAMASHAAHLANRSTSPL